MKTAPIRSTPLQWFLDALAGSPCFSDLTEMGMDELRAEVRAALPHLATIVISGEWANWTAEAPSRAINAVLATMKPADEHDPPAMNEQEAAYVVGLLTGLALAAALEGSRGQLLSRRRRAPADRTEGAEEGGR